MIAQIDKGKKVSDLTVGELVEIIEEIVERKIYELGFDPDEGLELKPEIIERLKKSFAETESGKRGIPAEEAAKKLGLEW
jgi:L-arabinose isomerase